MSEDFKKVVKPAVEECSVCGHVFIVAERVDGKPVCLSCKIKKDLAST